MKFRFLFFLLSGLLPFVLNGQKKPVIENFGTASFYHDSFNGLETSNGENYDKDDFTAAHRLYPFNTILLVTNKSNNRSVVVRVNDRGPFVRSRVIDLSHAAAKKLGMVPFGVAPVKIKELNFLDPAIMDDKLLHEGEMWDCYGQRGKLNDTSVFVWRTRNWKHAFYMASCLTLEFKLKTLLVKVCGPPEKRYYDLLIPSVEDKGKLNNLIADLRSSGFFESHIIYVQRPVAKLHDGRSRK